MLLIASRNLSLGVLTLRCFPIQYTSRHVNPEMRRGRYTRSCSASISFSFVSVSLDRTRAILSLFPFFSLFLIVFIWIEHILRAERTTLHQYPGAVPQFRVVGGNAEGYSGMREIQGDRKGRRASTRMNHPYETSAGLFLLRGFNSRSDRTGRHGFRTFHDLRALRVTRSSYNFCINQPLDIFYISKYENTNLIRLHACYSNMRNYAGKSGTLYVNVTRERVTKLSANDSIRFANDMQKFINIIHSQPRQHT